MRYFIQFLLLLGMIHSVHAQRIDEGVFTSAKQTQRYQKLINEIRCPVCQGQSISGSNAGLAQDLRQQVSIMIINHRSDDEIQKFMTDRYGDFVVFKPPVNKKTYLLWFTPFVFLVLSLFFFIRHLRNHKTPQKAQAIEIKKAQELLK